MTVRTEQHLFVYGTLKFGHGNHWFLGGAQFAGDDSLRGFTLFTLGVGGVPIMVPGRKEDVVCGERYFVAGRAMALIDRLESAYSKEYHVTESGAGVWTYVWRRGFPAPAVPIGGVY